MSVYYNENDPKAAAWLRELIFEGQIAWGDVDERSIEDVKPSELVGYAQCHFFAGIGGWSYALRLAGWPDDKPVWTGSCPCQPFSAAGRQQGFDDPRHLWPVWYELIRECAPSVIFGEQVASPAGLTWLDLVQANMEASAYAFGAADLCAAGVGAPHIRQRLYWVAHGGGERLEVLSVEQARGQRQAVERGGTVGGLVFPDDGRQAGETQRPQSGRAISPWGTVEWIACRDGKSRPVEPGTFPLAHGIPGRVGLLRGYGNAIVPQVAAAFIEATGLA